ncbi:hypothetical protein FisN_8Lh007 [Fistulifera solaris]|uniref:Uncharacterized protein n=1 Tax=Fistulifera solaris TaxID=1519565 RepID=A0A1Z5JD28_FISSO|nr:hypothetical protein FisN_8Lh007 [Fistulifera solaris]|eukprot:GAX11920.1 hypothetical protein FisN_8Lh007 [Fistulifera solaris]
MTFNRTCGSTFFALMLSSLALSLGQSSAIDMNLFGGRRNQFLCLGEDFDIVKLNDGQATRTSVLGANLFRRYSFTVTTETNIAECVTTGGDNGDVDLFICDTSDAGACMENPHDSSTESGTSESVATIVGAQTWYVIVKAGLAPTSFSVRCDENLPLP